MIREGWAQERAIKYEVSEKTGARLCRPLQAMGRPQSCILCEMKCHYRILNKGVTKPELTFSKDLDFSLTAAWRTGCKGAMVEAREPGFDSDPCKKRWWLAMENSMDVP